MNSVLCKTLVILATSTALSGISHAAGPEGTDSGHHSVGIPQPLPNRMQAVYPSATVLQEPKALAKISGGSTTLKWAPVKEASHYIVQVATDPNFKWLVKNEAHITENAYELGGLEAGQTYYWRVAAGANGNSSGYTQGRFKASSFETTK